MMVIASGQKMLRQRDHAEMAANAVSATCRARQLRR
jgi:hypothetical protein